MEEKIKMLTPDDVAEALQVSVEQVWRLLKSGKLKGVKIGKYWRITQGALVAFMEEGCPGSTKPVKKDAVKVVKKDAVKGAQDDSLIKYGW